MALLAGFPRRAQVLDGRGHRARIKVEGHGHQLPGAGDLGFHEPVGAGADVTLSTRDPGVGRALVGGVLRFHHHVAGRSAELHRLHHVNALVGCGGQDDDIDDGQHQEDEHRLAAARVVQIDDREGRAPGELRVLSHLLALEVHPHRDDDQSQGEERRQADERDDAQVGAALEADELDHQQGHDQGQGGHREGDARQADLVTGDGGEEMSGHDWVSVGRGWMSAAWVAPRRDETMPQRGPSSRFSEE